MSHYGGQPPEHSEHSASGQQGVGAEGKPARRVQVQDLQKAKALGRKLATVTCYDAAFARLIEQTASIDLVLVGDSVGNVILGQQDTVSVTLDDMVHHSRAVASKLKTPFLCADMPFMSYRASVEQAMLGAARLMQEGRAQGVKLEGGEEIVPQVQALVAAGIPVIGHLGLTPQSIHALGGHKVQARDQADQKRLLSDAHALQEAGVSALVLELVPAPIAAEVTSQLSIPTIGIGAGADCDGQILVLHDLLGFNPEFRPKFLKTYAQLADTVTGALQSYADEVRSGAYPSSEQSFS